MEWQRNKGLKVMGYGLRITDYRLRFTECVILRICMMAILLISSSAMFAQEENKEQNVVVADSVVGVVKGVVESLPDSLKPSKYIPEILEQQKLSFFQGFTLSADIFGPMQYLLSDYGSLEAALRLNLKNTYFPIFEAGFGKCDKTDDNTNIKYNVTAPYFRIGVDFNMLKNKFQENRLFAGVRYGLSSFNFDMSGPDLADPIWGGSSAFNHEGISTTCQWFEVVVGVQVKIWKNFHMGWSARYKKQLSLGNTDLSKPYYVPGYGTTVNESCWGGTYNLIFDLNWGKKHHKKAAADAVTEE